jgi:hypothetical protein
MGNLEAQDSNLVPNIAEGATWAGGQYLANKHMPGGGKLKATGRFAIPMMAANIAGLGASGLTGNNFYEKASAEQLGVDLGSQIAGGMAGEKLASGIGKALAKRAALAGAGRVLGGTAGFLAGPAGSAVGSMLGGTIASYLATKLFANEDEKMVEPGKGIDNSTVAALGAVGALASPLGKPVRKLAGKAGDYVFGPNGGPSTWLPPKANELAKQGMDHIKKFTDPLTQSDVVQDTANAYRTSRDKRHADNFAKRAADVMRGGTNKIDGTALNYQNTLSNFGAMGDSVENLGESLVNRYYKNRAA